MDARDHAAIVHQWGSRLGTGIPPSAPCFRYPLSSARFALLPRDKRRVVGRRVDAAGGVLDDVDDDRAARLQQPQLLELLGLFERRRRQVWRTAATRLGDTRKGPGAERKSAAD